PSTVRHTCPSPEDSSISLLAGASLHTLQHQRIYLAGGPNLSRFFQKASPAADSFNSIPRLEQKFRANPTVSGNSMPVFRKKALTSLPLRAFTVRSITTRLSFPPL